MNSSSNFFYDYIKAGSLETTQSELELLGRSCFGRVRARVAENPMTPTATLRELAIDDEIEVKVAVAGNSNTPRSIVWELANSDCTMTRLALAEEPGIPVSVLEKLSADENPYVVAEAAKTLHIISERQSESSKTGNDNIRDINSRLKTKVS